VLNKLSEQVRECLQHAEECARKAAAQSDPGLRDDFLRLEKRWLTLARSIEFGESLDNVYKSSRYRTHPIEGENKRKSAAKSLSNATRFRRHEKTA
jgi:hypothetical protein